MVTYFWSCSCSWARTKDGTLHPQQRLLQWLKESRHSNITWPCSLSAFFTSFPSLSLPPTTLVCSNGIRVTTRNRPVSMRRNQKYDDIFPRTQMGQRPALFDSGQGHLNPKLFCLFTSIPRGVLGCFLKLTLIQLSVVRSYSHPQHPGVLD